MNRLQKAKRNTIKIALNNARKRENIKQSGYSYSKDYKMDNILYGG